MDSCSRLTSSLDYAWTSAWREVCRVQHGRSRSIPRCRRVRKIKMRSVILLGILATAACGSGTPTIATSASITRCSASMGPLAGMVGPSATLADGGNVEVCGPGGKCTYLTEPPPGTPSCPDASVTVDNTGTNNISCPATTFVPQWTCVYASGSASGVAP
jgi:hypothetical protein